MKTKNSAWTAAEDAMLAQSVEDRVSTARLSVRLPLPVTSVSAKDEQHPLLPPSFVGLNF